MWNQSSPKRIVLAAWIIMLLLSLLPKVIVQEIFGQSVSPDLQAGISFAVIFLALAGSLAWQPLRGLRPLLVLFLVFTGIRWLGNDSLDAPPIYRNWLSDSSFNVFMLAEQSLHLVVTDGMIAALVLMRKKPQEYYLAWCDTAAPAAAIRWLGVKQGERWSSLGDWLSLFISAGTLAILLIAGRRPLDIVLRALPFLPAVLLAAALNLINEEVTYKAPSCLCWKTR